MNHPAPRPPPGAFRSLRLLAGRCLAAIRDGRGVTRQRILHYAAILLVLEGAAILVTLLLSHGIVDPFGRPLATDFMSFYSAGSLARAGLPAAVYDPAVHLAEQYRLAGTDQVPYYTFYYPPVFLLLCRCLAWLPYRPALALWLGAGMAAYATVLGRILGRGRLVPILAFPAVFLAIGHGQNALLTASLLGAATLAIDRRPVVAGLLLGCLCYKPQWALMVPVALIAGQRWRALAAAGLAAAALVGASIVAFGWSTWQAYRAVVPVAEHGFATGDMGFEKMATVFAGTRLLGGGIALGDVLQAVAIAMAGVATAWAWRRPGGLAPRGAVLVAATLCAAPILFDYDLVVAAVPMAWLVADGLERGFLPWERSLLAAAFVAPLILRTVGGLLHLPLGPVTDFCLLGLALRRQRRGDPLPLQGGREASELS